jgi:hypothetical protein
VRALHGISLFRCGFELREKMVNIFFMDIFQSQSILQHNKALQDNTILIVAFLSFGNFVVDSSNQLLPCLYVCSKHAYSYLAQAPVEQRGFEWSDHKIEKRYSGERYAILAQKSRCRHRIPLAFVKIIAMFILQVYGKMTLDKII